MSVIKKLGEKYPPWITYTSVENLKCIIWWTLHYPIRMGYCLCELQWNDVTGYVIVTSQHVCILFIEHIC